ncbi:MAG: LTA synthase family protein [Planctomycetota bacterium]|nr:LTA synthase family protein [Planctomycetota bacterium]
MSEIRLRNAILTSIKRTWWLVAVLLILMSGFRLLFTVQFAHPEIWSEFLNSLPMAFTFGALHDLRILLIFALPPTFSLLWMRDRTLDRWKSWLHRTSIYWFLGISAIVIVLAGEQIYYSYFRTRFNILAFGAIEDDVGAVLASAWQTYPLLLYLSVGLVLEYFVLRIIRRAFHFTSFLHAAKAPQAHEVERALNWHLATHTGLTVLLCLLPLTPIFVSLDDEYSQTAFVRSIPENGVEKLAETMWTRFNEEPLSTAKQYGFEDNAQSAIEAFTNQQSATDQGPFFQRLPLQAMQPTPKIDQPPHVVLVVLESFATHLLQYQSPEFDILGPAKTYFEKGILYERFLPCDNISIGTILGITLNLPYRPNTKHLSQSDQKSRSYPSSMAKLFGDRGYDTAFYYGGPSDWRELDQFLPNQGFEEILGMEDLIERYQLDLEIDGGPWGVWDEYLFRAVTERLSKADKPVFMVIFSTTNHSPHRLPADWRAKKLTPPGRLLARTGPLNEVQNAQVETYRYATYQLGLWLDGLKDASLDQRTIIGVTGDHTAGMGIPFSRRELLLQRAVPFLLLMPDLIANQFQADPLTPGSHKDIAPTLFHAAGLGPYGYRGLGTSLLAPNARHLGFNSSGLILTPQGAVRIHQDGFDAMRWKKDSLELEPSQSNLEDESALRTYQAALALTDWLIYGDSPNPSESGN